MIHNSPWPLDQSLGMNPLGGDNGWEECCDSASEVTGAALPAFAEARCSLWADEDYFKV